MKPETPLLRVGDPECGRPGNLRFGKQLKNYQ
jgi:hypothetical protein